MGATSSELSPRLSIHSEKVTFPGAHGFDLAARLDSPAGPIRAYALFAHCFTCSKDIFAAARVSKALTAHGIAVLRFDFTGLGSSDGEFANTNFTSNLGDLLAAVAFMRAEHQAPKIVIGHSLGGAAVLAVAPDIPEAVAIATIGAPFDPAHVSHNFAQSLDAINRDGSAEVSLGGRPFVIQKQFVEDISQHNLEISIAKLKKALLVFHSPVDDVVGVENAAEIFVAAKHPKSFVSLDEADHLLRRHEDSNYVAEVISAWVSRYLGECKPTTQDPDLRGAANTVVVAEAGAELGVAGKFAQKISVGGKHILRADEPASVGGADTGPTPYEFLLAGLGACTSMTMRMYAQMKGLPLERVSVSLRHNKQHATDCETCETQSGKIDRIEREIKIIGDDLTEADRTKLMEIADKCPVHRTLHSEVKIDTRAAE